MSECLLKFYMDFFEINKEEAAKKIRNTPLPEEIENEPVFLKKPKNKFKIFDAFKK